MLVQTIECSLHSYRDVLELVPRKGVKISSHPHKKGSRHLLGVQTPESLAKSSVSDQVMLQETETNLCGSQRQKIYKNIIFSLEV